MNISCTLARHYRKIFFSCNVQSVQAKMNLYLSIPAHNIISPLNIKDENEMNNNCCMSHTHISNKKR